MKTTAKASVLTYTIFLPSNSLMGANTKGPTPNPITNNVIGSKATSSLTLNASATSPISAVTIALLKATQKHVRATTIVHHHLYALLQFLGLSTSPSVNVTSS